MAVGVLDAILGARASTRLAVVLLLLCGFAAYTRFQVANLPRRSSALLEWVEDTVEGAAASHVAPQRHTPLLGLPTVSSLTANVRLTYVQRTFNVHLYVKGMFRLRLGSAPDGSAPKTRWY